MPVFPRTFLRTSSAVRHDIGIFLETMRSESKNGLHLGCGRSRIEGLINCDLYSPLADEIVDAIDLAMYQDGSVDYM